VPMAAHGCAKADTALHSTASSATQATTAHETSNLLKRQRHISMKL
jgi:hypothetical protein